MGKSFPRPGDVATTAPEESSFTIPVFAQAINKFPRASTATFRELERSALACIGMLERYPGAVPVEFSFSTQMWSRSLPQKPAIYVLPEESTVKA
jgi:hypothetical protein